jgi:catechol 2,3-dioxygenase-like lactoylglutathione lyase family enzyme
VTRSLARLSFLVRDYDEAILWFTEKLGFRLIEDTILGESKRWVRVGTDRGVELVLAAADGPEQEAAIGNQAGGRVLLFLETDDFAQDHARMRAAGITFREVPRYEPYGTVAVFLDLYGNPWDLIEPR